MPITNSPVAVSFGNQLIREAPLEYAFKQVDVFTDRPLYGNPLAVVLDADGIASDEMQRLARWTNLSETAFVLRPEAPGADYRVRIFTPAGELPFAGHPTIGSAHAVLESSPGLAGRTERTTGSEIKTKGGAERYE